MNRKQAQNETFIHICLFGAFRVLIIGDAEPVSCGSKGEALLCLLAMHSGRRLRREMLLEAVWPGSDDEQACQSLNALVHHLRKVLGEALDGASPICNSNGYYWLNLEAGIAVDLHCFDTFATAGNEQACAHNQAAAVENYLRAITRYEGDLCCDTSVSGVIERERLRARFLHMLCYVADYYFNEERYRSCLQYAEQLLRHDPCREDAHRLIMRCYVRQNERAQALRQYRLCAEILRSEFDMEPEPDTTALFDQARLDPASI